MCNTSHKYFHSIVHDHSSFVRLYLLHSKDQTSYVFLDFKVFVEKQYLANIKTIQMDKGLEFKPIGSILIKQGM